MTLRILPAIQSLTHLRNSSLFNLIWQLEQEILKLLSGYRWGVERNSELLRRESDA